MLDRDCSDKQQLLKDSYKLHNHFQGLAGSGIDVAASVFGGVFRYQISGDKPDSAPSIKMLPIPSSLQMRFVWTGQPASTADYLKKMSNYRKHNEAKFNRIMQSLANLAGAGCEAFLNGRTDTFFQVVQDYYDRLEQLGAESRIPIISNIHRQIAETVDAGGGFYKPSGAGGGDFGIIFGSDKSHITELAQRVARNGFTVTDIDVGAKGIKFSADEGGIHDSIRLPQTV
jgi:phosphomevalonate kinase